MIQQLGTVSSEGGPLLIADADLTRYWHGVDGDDYERACQLFNGDNYTLPGHPIVIKNSIAAIWSMGGSGTSYILRFSIDRIMILRPWLNPTDEKAVIQDLAAIPVLEGQHFANLRTVSGVLAVLWAPENGDCIKTLNIEDGQRPTDDIAIDGAGILVKMPAGDYSLVHDRVKLTTGASALRCHIEPAKSG